MEIDEVAQLIGDIIDAHEFTLKCLAQKIPHCKVAPAEDDWGYNVMKGNKFLGTVYFASVDEHRVLTEEEICAQVQELKNKAEQSGVQK